MSNYPIHFNEGKKGGYLLVKALKSGTQGKAVLVRSVEGGKLYIRKRMSIDSTMDLVNGVPREVYAMNHLRRDPSLPQYWPRLVEYTHLKEEGKGEWSIIFQYCNGGDLEDLIKQYGMLGEPVPEALIWHIAAQISKALAYLHHGLQTDGSYPPNWQPFFHADVCPSNVFLHYPPPSPSANNDSAPSSNNDTVLSINSDSSSFSDNSSDDDNSSLSDSSDDGGSSLFSASSFSSLRNSSPSAGSDTTGPCPLPQVLLGDFGSSITAPTNDAGITFYRQDEARLDDTSGLKESIFWRLATAYYPPETRPRDRKQVHPSYSNELKQIAAIFAEEHFSRPATALELADTLGPIADRHIAAAVEDGESFKRGDCQPVEFSAPALFTEHTRSGVSELKQPWEWVTVSDDFTFEDAWA